MTSQFRLRYDPCMKGKITAVTTAAVLAATLTAPAADGAKGVTKRAKAKTTAAKTAECSLIRVGQSVLGIPIRICV